jgi:hypothetical protein
VSSPGRSTARLSGEKQARSPAEKQARSPAKDKGALGWGRRRAHSAGGREGRARMGQEQGALGWGRRQGAGCARWGKSYSRSPQKSCGGAACMDGVGERNREGETFVWSVLG